MEIAVIIPFIIISIILFVMYLERKNAAKKMLDENKLLYKENNNSLSKIIELSEKLRSYEKV